ncbi:MAG: DUF2889 domain-containing protein [Acidimicrobiales bacterium]|nr:DUF2889 domain-containing protein [Acidimicrobiales bacterium]
MTLKNPRNVPPTVTGLEAFDRLVEIPPYDYEGFGNGLCRRRIRLTKSEHNRTIGELEDDFHHFRVELTHDQEKILSVEGSILRAPWSTCSEANHPLQKIIGSSLSSESTAIGGYASPTSNCTHLFDLTGLVISHTVQEQIVRQYDLMVTDPSDHKQDLLLWRDGELLLAWTVQADTIIEPPEWEGVSLQGKFIPWAIAQLDPKTAEAAIALRRMLHISSGHGINLDKLENGAEHLDGPIGRCYTYTDEVLLRATRMKKTVRNFEREEHASLMLADMDTRGQSQDPAN